MAACINAAAVEDAGVFLDGADLWMVDVCQSIVTRGCIIVRAEEWEAQTYTSCSLDHCGEECSGNQGAEMHCR